MKKNEEWKDLTRTLEENKENHKKIIKQIEEKKDGHLYIDSFENEYGERYVITNVYSPKIFMIAGDETSWEFINLIKIGTESWIGATETFSFNDKEVQQINKILY